MFTKINQSSMSKNILDTIIEHKLVEVAARKKR